MQEIPQGEYRLPAVNPPWRSRSFCAALGLAIVGLFFWFRTPAPEPPADSKTTASEPAAKSPAPKALLGKDAPLLFRVGISFAGGFLVGWAWRKSLRLALTIGGILLGLVAAVKLLGIGISGWDGMTAQIRQGTEWFAHEANAMRKLFTGFLPSTFATILGLWRGARRG